MITAMPFHLQFADLAGEHGPVNFRHVHIGDDEVEASPSWIH